MKSIIIAGEEKEVLKIVRENRIRMERNLISISDYTTEAIDPKLEELNKGSAGDETELENFSLDSKILNNADSKLLDNPSSETISKNKVKLSGEIENKTNIE